MDVWADRLATCLASNKVMLHMLTKYVDDINTVMSLIPKGSHWLKKANYYEWKLVWDEETLAKDLEEGKTDTPRTMELVKKLRDNLVPGLKLTYDLPELHQSGMCPMLDI